MTVMLIPDERHLFHVRGELTDVAFVVPSDATMEELCANVTQFARAQRTVRWWIGDCLIAAESRYGEAASQILGPELGLTAESIRSSAWVAEKVSPDRRRASLSWSHHQEIASLEPDEQIRFLDEAEANGWTSGELRRQVRKVAPRAQKCSKCGTPCAACKQPPQLIEIL